MEYNSKYTGAQVEEKLDSIPKRLSELDNDRNFVSSDNMKTVKGESLVGVGDITFDEFAKIEDVNAKQDKLIEGEGISIVGNTISCTHDKTLYKVVTELPSVGEEHKIYLIVSTEQEENNIYNEYAWIDGRWEALGKYKATIDLTPYALKSEIPTDVLKYTEQTLTDEQKTQAKKNLGISESSSGETEMIIMRAYLFDMSGNYSQAQIESAFGVKIDDLIAGIKAGKAIVITSSSTSNGNYNIVFGCTYTLLSDNKTLSTLSMLWWQYSQWCTLNVTYNTTYADYDVTITKSVM